MSDIDVLPSVSESTLSPTAVVAVKGNSVPPIVRTRNQYGLISDGSVNYIYGEDGFVDWRKMIKPEFLVVNSQAFQRNGKPVPETTAGLEDKDLLILLGGIKDLAQIRGFMNVTYQVRSPHNDYVLAVCSIVWIPNYETEGRTLQFSGIGDASMFNTSELGRKYLGPIAENRAFVRAVRNFLKINIVSSEEIGPNSGKTVQAEDEDMATVLLADTLKKFNLTFEKVKERLVKEGVDGAEKFQSIVDIPRFKKFELVERINNKAAALGKA